MFIKLLANSQQQLRKSLCLRGGNFGMVWAKWLRETARWLTSLVI